MNIEDVKKSIGRRYGFKFENSALMVRIPKTSVYELLQSDIFYIYASLKKKMEKTKVTEIYVVADESHLRIDIKTFLDIIKNRVSIEDMLRGGKRFEISDRYKDDIKKMLDHTATPLTKSISRGRSGRRTEVITKGIRGRPVRYRVPKDTKNVDVALIPTIKTAATRTGPTGRFSIQKQDIRANVRRRHISASLAIVYDASGSVDDEKKKGVITAVMRLILASAYERRDEVALVSYSGTSASVAKDVTPDVTALDEHVQNIQIGGTTPLASGILTGMNLLMKRAGVGSIPVITLITDGTANVPIIPGRNIQRELFLVCRRVRVSGIKMLILDVSQNGSMLTKRLAIVSNGTYYHLGFG
jgi:magnesium chelatase subunit D